MISKSELSGSAGGVAGYYTNEQARAEYYSSEAVPSAWRGRAAQALGLRGPVEARDLENVLAGRVIDATGARQLGTRRGGELHHRAGWDFTISAPKSVSIQALVHGDKAALEAHRTAVGEALAYLERHGAVFRPQSGDYREGVGLAIATFEHVSSRARDPQLHTHALIANVTVDASGRAYSVSNERLFQHRAAADAVYHSVLARELEHAGYSVRFDRSARVEIDHYHRESLRDFSKRSKEIEAALAARGLTREQASAQTRAVLALDTRSVKTLPETREAHAERWRAQAEALGVTAAQPAARVERRPEREAEAAAVAVERATEHLTEREAVFSRAELHREALRFSEGRAGIDAIEHEIARREKAGELLRADDGGRTPRYTTREALEDERDTDRRLHSGKGAHLAVMQEKEFDRALAAFEARKGFELSDEQRAAARMILTGGDRFQGVQGLAGTGKTTMLEFVREAAEAKGWTVRGHSNGAEQAAVLERESGIASTTTARHLIDEHRARQASADGGPAPARRELRIMDEAGMAGQRAFADVVRTTEQAGARTVMLGDVRQHQSVERGRAFERAQAHMPVARLGEASIRRQKTEHLKAAVADVLHRRETQALARLQVREIAPERQAAAAAGKDRLEVRAAAVRDNAHVIRQLARDYAALPSEQRARTLVLTSTNADRKAINEAIREELRGRGELARDGAQARVLRAADMTREEARRAASYREGQVVEVTSGRGRGREAMIERFEVARIDSRTNILHVRDEAGQVRQIDPAQRGQRVQAYEAEARGLSVGDRMRFTENHALPNGERVRNGQTAVVERVEGERVHLRVGDGEHARHVVADARALKADHDYCSTSYSAQGRTVDNVIIHHNTEAGRHSDRETYVNVTRAREEVAIYTQDSTKMERQVGIETSKSAAHDVAAAADRQHQHEEQRQQQHGAER